MQLWNIGSDTFEVVSSNGFQMFYYKIELKIFKLEIV